MEDQVTYYTRKGSNVLKPHFQTKANTNESLQAREQRKAALANEIFTMIENLHIPSYDALDILKKVQNKVIANQGKLDRAYQKEKDR